MRAHRFPQLRADLTRGVERCAGILEYHGDLRTAHPAVRLRGEGGDVAPVKGYRTRKYLCGETADLCDCLEQGGLAAAALADDAEHLASAEAEADILDDGITAVACGQMLNAQQLIHDSLTSCPDLCSHGSSRSALIGSR